MSRITGPRRRRPGFFALAALLALILGAALVGGRSPAFERLERGARTRTVPSSAFGVGTTRQILQRLGVIHQLPPEPVAAAGMAEPGRERLAWRRPNRAESYHSLDPLPVDQWPASFRIDPQRLGREVPVLALLLPEESLQELMENPAGRGREWEREAFLAYLERGRSPVLTGIGLRLHGGATRRLPAMQSFRLVFRDRYGLSRFPPGLFPLAPGIAPRRLVLANNNDGIDPQGRRMHFVNPLAYDIARQVGFAAPHTRPVMLFINGDERGVFILTEYLDLDFLRTRHGHDRFVLARTKRNRGERGTMVRSGDPSIYDAFARWVMETSPIELEEAARRVDLDNLSRWYITMLFCASGDIFNGPLVLDLRRPGSRWRWIAWDLEFSFGSPYFPNQAGWQRDIFPYTLFGRRRHNLRAVLLRKLFTDSPEFRVAFCRLFSEAMNHRLTGPFLEERVGHYRRIARATGIDDGFFDGIEQFLEHRKAELRRQMDTHLGTGPSFRVTALAPPGGRLRIDGYGTGSAYTGWYFRGQRVEVEIPERDRKAFLYWTVDGRPVAGSTQPLRLEVDADLAIRAVFAESEQVDLPS